MNSDVAVGNGEAPELHAVGQIPPRIPSHVFPTRHQGAAIISRHQLTASNPRINAGIVGRSATGDKTVHYRKGNESGTESHRSRERFAGVKSPTID